MLVKQKFFYSNRQENLLKLNEKRLYPKNSVNSVKYLDISINEKLNWTKPQSSDGAIKLNKENGILSKLRQFIDWKTLKTIYHAIFKPHL